MTGPAISLHGAAKVLQTPWLGVGMRRKVPEGSEAHTMAIPIDISGSTKAHKRIRLKKQDDATARKIAEQMNLNPVIGRILAARGFQANEDLKHFISPTLKEGLPDPSKLKNLPEACKLIHDVHKAGQGIAICCDFDVDGLSGGSIVHDFFNNAKVASRVFVPDRFVDGYGLNEKVVRQIAKDGYGLLLTIDFGTTNAKSSPSRESLV
jgi:single-stranded-DNA-specific exonuclease